MAEHPTPLLVFDPTLTRDSPIGSCLVAMLEPIVATQRVHLFTNRTDLAPGGLLSRTKIRVPRRPVFARAILYTLFASSAYWLSPHTKSLRIASEGAFPFCQISYAQFCHRFFLSHHRDALGSGRLRRIARTITHAWGALTEKIAFRSARTIVVPSRGLARELESVYPALVRNKIRVIPNPVDTARFSRPPDFSISAFRTHLAIPLDAFVLSFCALGNFERKGLHIVLQALADLGNPAIHLLVIGGTPGEIREFTTLAARHNLQASVHFAGFQSDIRPYLWSSNAFVFPSAYETFCLACFQAAAAGLPLIVTTFSGIDEFVEPGGVGWLVERNSNSLAAAIRDAAASPEKVAAFGREAQARAQLYSKEKFQARWLALLAEEHRP